MAGGYKFAPLNVRAVYQNDGSAKSSFLAEVDRMTRDAGRMFKDFSSEAASQLDAALSVKRNSTGSLDLGVNELRAAAAAQQARATAAREVAVATALAAKEEGDYSQQARLAVAATQALAKEEESAAASARAHAAAAEQVQERLNRQASATDLVVAATKRGTNETQNVINGLRAQRQAGIQAGQQLQDMAVQFQMGTNASTIMAQQLPQLAFSLSGLENNANKTLSKIGSFATFLSGPWGAAIAIGMVALGPFIDELYRTLTAADDATEALQKFINKQREASAGAVEEAQAMIGLNKARSEMLEIDLRLSKRPKRPDGTPMFSYADLERQKALRWQIVEAEGAIQSAETKREMAAKQRTSTTRTPRTAGGRASSGGGSGGRNLAVTEFWEDAGKKIANIRDSFADIPPEVERVNKASRELDDIISDLMNRRPKGFEALKDEAEALKESLADGVVTQALDGMAESSQRQLQIQEMLLSGRDAEASALQNLWQIEKSLGSETELRTKAQALIVQGRTEEAAILNRIADQYPRIRSDVQAIAEAEQKRIEALQRAQEIQQVFLDSTRNIRSEVEGILGGYGKLSDLGSTLRRSFQQIQGKILTEKLFGDMFRDMDKWVKEKTGTGSSVDMMAKETERAGGAAGRLADELAVAAQRIAGVGSSATSAAAYGSSAISGGWANIGIPALLKAPANENFDPNAEIVVQAEVKKEAKRKVSDLSPEEYFRDMGQKVGAKWADFLEPLLGKKLAGNLGGVLGGVLEGQATTGTGFGAILGGLKELKGLPKGLSDGLGKAFKGAQTGAQIAGIGNALGIKMSNTGAQVGGALGEAFFGPVGGIVGSIAGGFFGKLFSGTKKGYAVATNSGVKTGGNSTQAANAGNAANGLNDSLNSLAKSFGTSLGNYAVSIGSRSSGYIRVSASGSSKVGDKNYNKGPDVLYDGKDMEEALRIALKNAIEDGAIQGIRAGSKRLLTVGSSIDAQVEKALKFENVFKTLKSIKDPVGAALDDLNSEFKGLIDIFKEAGASAEEMGQLEELYGIKRKEAVEQATQAMTASLKGLLDELNIGSDYYSLRDRKQSALDVYNPLKARVAAGDTTAFDAFSDAARNLISIEREISGSTSPFFALLKEVTDLSKGALNGVQTKIDTATASDSPFSALAAQNAATTSAIDNQTTALLGALGTLNDNLVAALRAKVASGDTSDVTSLLRANGSW